MKAFGPNSPKPTGSWSLRVRLFGARGLRLRDAKAHQSLSQSWLPRLRTAGADLETRSDQQAPAGVAPTGYFTLSGLQNYMNLKAVGLLGEVFFMYFGV